MYRLSGCEHVVSTDLSQNLIERMRERACRAGLPKTLEWLVADFTSLPFQAGSFDVVIEKGGIDCLLTTVRDPWNVPADTKALCRCVLTEIHRVLSPRGCLLSVTFSAPHFRRPLLYDGPFDWRVQHDTFGDGDSLHYSLYLARRGMKRIDEPGENEAATSSVFVPAESMEHDYLDTEDFLLRIGLL